MEEKIRRRMAGVGRTFSPGSKSDPEWGAEFLEGPAA